ncbi:family 16 glycosylhydrolase [Aquimarina algiphila]|uniref:glycoside hydrolase family 16 protein n=1 Tax=Aquimarina algiphila TaxID=2047982 RepID=UPI00232B3BD4|nr:family 16 glycosylhydrolase [Aquimarina algiphila]
MIRIVLKRIFALAFLFAIMSMNAQIPPPNTPWVKIFSEEFDGSSVNTSDWIIRTDELRGFSSNSLDVSGGTLKINNTYPAGGRPLGGWIESRRKPIGNDRYGYYEARIRITADPNGRIWPTWWIWGKNFRNGAPGPTATEFDLMEYSGFATRFFENKATTSHHYSEKRVIDGKTKIDASIESVRTRNAFEWHVWGMYWTPTEVSFYYDGVKYLTTDQPEDAANDPYDMSLILSSSPHTVDVADYNSGSGGFQPNHPDAATAAQAGQTLPSFEIDWVRVWSLGSTVGTSDCQGLPNDICQAINITNTNFKVRSAGESCKGSKNATISIEATQKLQYTAVIEGTSMSNEFDTTTSFDGLGSGNYTVCITAEGLLDFKQCFELVIKEPQN